MLELPPFSPNDCGASKQWLATIMELVNVTLKSKCVWIYVYLREREADRGGISVYLGLNRF